jgi:hypothetical protein
MVCSKCGEEKPVTEFYAKRRQCNKCMVKRRMDNREANVERDNATMRRYYHANREKCMESHRNRESERHYNVKWERAHPEWVRARNIKRRAMMAGAFGTFSLPEWNDMISETGHRCVYCGRGVDSLSMEHVIPLIKGGRNDTTNIVPACLRCNHSKKDDDDLILFLYRLGMEREKWMTC